MANNGRDSLIELVQTHQARHPVMEVADLYKLLHQATFGVGRAIPNRKTAREWLDHEAKLAYPKPTERLIESVHPENTFVRVHLRAYLGVGGKLPPLLEGYIRSSEAVQGSALQLAEWWQLINESIRGGLLTGFDGRLVQLTGRVRAAEGWAGMHHSPTYHAHYQPLYRILTLEQARAVCGDQRLSFPTTL
jgi:hypothetical protein